MTDQIYQVLEQLYCTVFEITYDQYRIIHYILVCKLTELTPTISQLLITTTVWVHTI